MPELIKNQPKRRFPRRLAGVGILFGGLQLFPAQRVNPTVPADFIALAAVPEPQARLLRAACYDCHSHETRWPWYAHIAPVSWRVTRHVHQGRERLNFSDWPQARPWTVKADLDSVARALRDASMPPWDYCLLHPSANMTSEERLHLAAWIETNTLTLPLRHAL